MRSKASLVLAAALVLTASICVFLTTRPDSEAPVSDNPSCGASCGASVSTASPGPQPERRVSKSATSSDPMRQRVESLSGEQALRSRIEELLPLPDSFEKQRELALIGEKLSRELGLKRATEIVTSLAGPGRIREDLLEAVVTGAREDFKTVVGIVRGIELPEDRGGGMNGWTHYLSRNNCSMEEILACGPFSRDEMDVIVLTSNYYLVNRTREKDPAARVKGEVNRVQTLLRGSGLGDPDQKMLFRQYLRSISDMHPIECLTVVSETLGPYGSASQKTYDRVLENAFKIAPQRAIETIVSMMDSDKPTASPELVHSAMLAWMKCDQSAAFEWTKASHKYGDKIQSSAAIPFFEQAIDNEDLALAQTLAAQINDPQFKQYVEDELRNLKQDQLKAPTK